MTDAADTLDIFREPLLEEPTLNEQDEDVSTLSARQESLTLLPRSFSDLNAKVLPKVRKESAVADGKLPTSKAVGSAPSDGAAAPAANRFMDSDQLGDDQESEEEPSVFAAAHLSVARKLQECVAKSQVGPIMERILKSTFNIEKFRPGQAEAILAVAGGQSVLAELPTAWGKSLCYQFAAIMMRLMRHDGTKSSNPGFALVISPLLSLVQDQISEIHRMGLPLRCAAFSSGMNKLKETQLLGQLRGDNEADPIDLVFISPERLAASVNFRSAFAEAKDRCYFVCIDEAHCVSEWSHDFRPTYMHIRHAIKHLCGNDETKIPPFMALTATASREVRREILANFKVARHVKQEVPRDNLKLCAEMVYGVDATGTSESEAHGILLSHLTGVVRRLETPMIVYVSTQAEAESVASHLREKFATKKQGGKVADRKRGRGDDDEDGVDDAKSKAKATEEAVVIRSYHAGMPLSQRSRVQKGFIEDEVDVLVATVAFGMGINKPDIRSIVHLYVPPSLEEYIQEVGRAGRDGKESTCIVLYNPTRFYDLRSRVASGMLTFQQLEQVVHALYAPATRVKDDVHYDYNYVHVDSVGLSTGCSSEVVETLLFQIASTHLELVTVEGLIPLRCLVPDPAKQKSKAAKKAQANCGMSSSTMLEQLSIQDAVLEYCRTLPTKNMDLVLAASALKLPLPELVTRLKELSSHQECALSITFSRYSYVVRFLSRSLEQPAHMALLVKESFARRKQHYARSVRRLHSTFAALQCPAHSAIAELLEEGNLGAAKDDNQWQPPKPGINIQRAVEIVADLYRTDGPRLMSALEAAKVLTGALYGGVDPGVTGGLTASTWRQNPHYGRLREYDVEWVTKVAEAHTRRAAGLSPSMKGNSPPSAGATPRGLAPLPSPQLPPPTSA